MSNTPTVQETMQAVSELRAALEAKYDPVLALKADKINSFLDKQETINQEILAGKKAAENQALEIKEQLANLEKQLANPALGKSDVDQAKLEVKALENFARTGEFDAKYLRTDKGTDGGFLVPAAYELSIRKNITEISDIRRYAKVSTIGAGRIEMPNRQSLVTVSWGGEGSVVSTSKSTYGLDTIKTFKIQVGVDVTNEDLADAAFNMEVEINADAAEAFAQKEGAAFINGTSATSNQDRPEGIMVNGSVGIRNTGSAAALTMDSILLLTGDVKVGYNPVFGMTRSTAALVRTLKDGTGQYYWQAGSVAAGIPNQIAGYEYFIAPDFDEVGANAYPILFGDLRMGYQIVDRAALEMIRDPYSKAREGKVAFTFTRRVGGQVTRAEALKKLRCAV
jgi:HK97 family phage major capsid protein